MNSKFLRCAAPLLIVGAGLSTATATPAAAQVGGIVHDPRNYAQNILTAARTLEQINNQIKQLQNQATSLANEARNLSGLPVSTLQELQGQVDRTRELLGEAQRVAFDVGDIQKAFDARYKGDALTGTQAESGAQALNEYARQNDPFAEIGKRQVAVDVSSVIRASKDSFRIGWTERRYQDGSLLETTRWSAIVTVTVQPPRTPDALRRNPLGIFVTAVNWSKELSQ